MAEEPKPKGLFSSLSLGRATKAPRQPSETLTHPLLGASSSSLHLPTAPAETATTDAGPSVSQPAHVRQDSYTKAGSDISGLPYKPRQRHGPRDSAGSMNSLLGGGGGPVPGSSVSPNLAPVNHSSGPGTSPTTPTNIMAAPATTSTSTSATFTLPATASEAQINADGPHTISSSTSASATARLQQQSVKAAAQKIGLGNGTMGMAIIDAVFDKCQVGKGKMAEGGDWADVIKILTVGKAVLLLPTAPASSLPVTPQILRDHVLFTAQTSTCLTPRDEKSEHESAPQTIAVFLSGIVGIVSNNTFTVESILPADSSLMQGIRDATTRQTTILSLRPAMLSSTVSRPTFDLSGDTASLPFPPINRNPAPISGSEDKEKEKDKDRAAQTKFGRINPFASFFGQPGPSTTGTSSPASPRGAHTPEKPLSPVLGSSPSGAHGQLSPRPSLLSMQFSDSASVRSQDVEQNDGFRVTAYTVSRPIRSTDVHKSLSKAVRSAVKEELSGLPDRLVDRVCKLALVGVCPTSAPSDSIKSQNLGDHDPSLDLDFTDPSATGDKLQDFVETVYDEVTAHGRSEEGKTSALRRRASGNKPWQKNEDGASEKGKLTRQEVVEKEASDAAERVEGVLCRLLYNRIFSPIESDDARHDEVLASRIAALNMLDLSLDHLGLITQPDELSDEIEDKTSVQTGLRQIVHDIGLEFQRLSQPSCLSPKDKADILIKAHKIVVDGLAALPPIQLRPEGEPYKPAPSAENVESVLSASSGDPSPADTPPLELQDFSIPDPDATPLSREPSRDPFDEDAAAINERTPSAFEARPGGPVPDLTISDPAQSLESSMIEEAMTDSVMTAQPSNQSSGKTTPPQQKQSTSGADLILPIIIFAVVKANPAQLASHLMYLRRYRSAICLTGEASYAIVNLTAVVEFLEHVDMAELGLGDDSGKVISVEDLSPIGLTYLDESNADAASIVSASSRLRGRVFQVTEMAGSAADSANKVLTGVVDSSWTALRGLMGTNADQQAMLDDPAASDSTVPRPNMRPRQASSFSLASVTASVASIAAAASTAAARSRSRATSRASETQQQWTGNQEMIEVSSRPESIHELYTTEEEPTEQTAADGDEEEQEKDRSDIKSIKSVTSMMSKDESGSKPERPTLSNRLASIGVLGRLSSPQTMITTEEGLGTSPPDGSPSKASTGLLATLASGRSRGTSLLGGGADSNSRSRSPARVTTTTPPPESRDPPMERFMTCDVGDIKLSEVGPLLRDYRRLAGIIESLQKGQL